MEFSGQALVLRVGRFREADLWVRFLSSSRGVTTAFAFGGSRSRRRFPGCLDQLNVVHFRVKSSRTGNFLTLEEGTLLRGPARLRHDWQRFGIALNCLKFIESFDVPPDSAAQAFALATDLMECLECAEGGVHALPPLFRARFAFDQGYGVDFFRCAACGSDLGVMDHAFFLSSEGLMLCPACRHDELFAGPVSRLNAEGLDLMRGLRESSPLEWMQRAHSPEALRECGRAIDNFIQYHVGLIWDAGRFKRV